VKVTALTITDEQIRALRQEMIGNRRRQNAYTRAIRQDCDAALDGDRACRESCALAWNKLVAENRAWPNAPATAPPRARGSSVATDEPHVPESERPYSLAARRRAPHQLNNDLFDFKLYPHDPTKMRRKREEKELGWAIPYSAERIAQSFNGLVAAIDANALIMLHRGNPAAHDAWLLALEQLELLRAAIERARTATHDTASGEGE
jgi:hypothetical protein